MNMLRGNNNAQQNGTSMKGHGNNPDVESGESSHSGRNKRQSRSEPSGCGAWWARQDDQAKCGWSFAAIAFIVVPIIIILASSFATVEPNETGLMYNTPQAVLHSDLLSQGLQTIAPFGTVLRWPTKYTNIEFIDNSGGGRVVCNSKDGLELRIHIEFQYLAQQGYIYELTKSHKDFEGYDAVIRSQAVSASQNACGEFTAEEYQTRRSEVAISFGKRIASVLEEDYHALLKRFNLKDVQRPQKYEQIVQDKENARSDIQLANNENLQALTRADTLLQKADQEKQKKLDKANTESKLTLIKANNEAQGVMGYYESLATIYSDMKRLNSLTSAGILSVLSNDLFSSGKTQLAAASPSKLSYLDEL